MQINLSALPLQMSRYGCASLVRALIALAGMPALVAAIRTRT
jgi:hypothetical protein